MDSVPGTLRWIKGWLLGPETRPADLRPALFHRATADLEEAGVLMIKIKHSLRRANVLRGVVPHSPGWPPPK